MPAIERVAGRPHFLCHPRVTIPAISATARKIARPNQDPKICPKITTSSCP
jgi:hypothetical protein